MNPRLRPLLFVLAALVMAFSYLAGALVPPLHAGPAAPAITAPQWVAVQQAISLLIDQSWYQTYLPMIMR